VSGQGLLAVGFDHRTSREGDPLLHTHLVVANRIQGPDGRWTALDGRDLYRHRLATDAIYRASYQRELVRTLQVEWTVADAHGNRELQGLPEGLIQLFSKRTDQIDLEIQRLEEDGRKQTPRLVKWVVHATRKPKEHQTPDTLYGRWRTEAAERGVDADALVRQVSGRTVGRDQGLSERTVSNAFARLACPDGLTAQASTFARQDVIAALGGELAGATRADLEGLADRFCAERAVAGGGRAGAGGAPLVHPRAAGRRAAARFGGRGPGGRADRRGQPRGGAGGAGRPSHRWPGPGRHGPRRLPRRRRRRLGRGSGGDRQDLRAGRRPARLAAGRLPAPGRRPPPGSRR
jgi:TrwC relaxase